MEKISNLSTLAKVLAENEAQDLQRIEALTNEQLGRHAQSLRTLSSDELASMKSAIDSMTSTLNAALNGTPDQDGILPAIASQARTIAAGIGKQTAATDLALEKQTRRLLWLLNMPLLAMLGLCLATCAATWGWSAYRIGQARDAMAEQALAEKTLAKIEARTWGLKLHQDKDGRFLILPPGTRLESDWIFGKNPAVKLN